METKWERRSCEACQSEFEPVREAQVYCSPRCRNSAKVRAMVRPSSIRMGQRGERCEVTTTHLPMTPTGIQSYGMSRSQTEAALSEAA